MYLQVKQELSEAIKISGNKIPLQMISVKSISVEIENRINGGYDMDVIAQIVRNVETNKDFFKVPNRPKPHAQQKLF
jgi:hypothetical protein